MNRILLGVVWIVGIAMPSFGQVPVDVSAVDLQGLLSPPLLLGGRQCGPGRPVSLSLSAGAQGNLYELYEYDLVIQKVGALVGSFPVAPNAKVSRWAL